MTTDGTTHVAGGPVRLGVAGHSCVRLVRGDDVLVIDPGSWSDTTALADVTAVLVTHVHPDHVAVDAVVEALHRDGSLTVDAPDAVVEALREAGAPADRLRTRAAGERWDVAGFEVEALGGEHAVVHPDLPGTANLAYLVDGRVLHPGDSFTPAPGPVEVLLVPVAAPWLRAADAVDYVRAVAPGTAVPIHDGALTDAGRALVDRVVGGLGGVPYRRLAIGDVLEVGG